MNDNETIANANRKTWLEIDRRVNRLIGRTMLRMCVEIMTGDLSMSQIVKRLDMNNTSHATSTVDAAERLGLVERYHSKEDRRVIMVGLTNKGFDELATAFGRGNE